MLQAICAVMALVILVETWFLFNLRAKLATARTELESLVKGAEASVVAEVRTIVGDVKSLLSRL